MLESEINEMLQNLEIETISLDNVKGAPEGAASSGSGGHSTCGSSSSSSSTCSSCCA